jgi:hypothetical protein
MKVFEQSYGNTVLQHEDAVTLIEKPRQIVVLPQTEAFELRTATGVQMGKTGDAVAVDPRTFQSFVLTKADAEAYYAPTVTPYPTETVPVSPKNQKQTVNPLSGD